MTERRRKFKYRWTRICAEVSEDYSAFDDAVRIGRVHLVARITTAKAKS